MGIVDIFRKDEVVGTKVMVCAFDGQFTDILKEDTEIYRRYYPATMMTTFPGVDELMEAIGHGYDVIHLLCNVNPKGTIAGSSVTGTEIIRRCCSSNVKLLWIGSDNILGGYIAGFNARGQRLNLVMTIKRNGLKFSDFLGRLLFEMSCGNSMPAAWSALCPQIPGASYPETPESIFFAGRGSVRLR